jgi:hypothetical protein
MLVKTVKGYYSSKTVGCLYNRYRLGHKWVSVMMLNVQSDSLRLPKISNSNILYNNITPDKLSNSRFYITILPPILSFNIEIYTVAVMLGNNSSFK